MSLPNKNSYSNLGGELKNYHPITDPTTDLDANATDDTRSDIAAMTRTSVRAWVRFNVHQLFVGHFSLILNAWDAVYGNDPSNQPVLAYVDFGNYTVTFPSTVVDSLGVTRSLNLQDGWCNYKSADTMQGYYKPLANVTGPNTVKVTLWDSLGPAMTNPANFNSDTITLFVI